MTPKLIAVVATTAALAACAPRAEDIRATYTSPALYENLTCEQLLTEAQVVSNHAHDAAHLENRHRLQDEVVVAGAVIFWPAVLLRHGADMTAGRVAQLKGEMEAIEAASRAKNCGIVFQHTEA